MTQCASRCASVFTCLRDPDVCSIIADLTLASKHEYGPGTCWLSEIRDKRGVGCLLCEQSLFLVLCGDLMCWLIVKRVHECGFLLLQNFALEFASCFDNSIRDSCIVHVSVWWVILLDTGKFLFGSETVCDPQQLTYIDVRYTNLRFLYTGLNKMLKLVHCTSVLVIWSHTEC